MISKHNYPDLEELDEYDVFSIIKTNDNDTISIQKDLQSNSPVVQAELLSEKLTKNMER